MASRVVAEAARADSPITEKAAEEPLTPEEIARMRGHLRFLKEHRRVLHLRVNAHEDLLLNAKREPTRRGVCQHLLSKVDRAHVFRAAERLEPAAATRLAEGVLRISPNIDYLLLYLDCVRRSESQGQAVAALAQALESIDFLELSAGQMRRVLNLVVEQFSAEQLPLVLLGLLEGNAFRSAFDASAAELPEALGQLLRPIREVQTVVVRERAHGRGDPELLARGVRLLLAGGERALLGYPPPTRQRLLELGIRSGAAADPKLGPVLDGILESLRSLPQIHRQLAQALAQDRIRAGDDEGARKLLKALTRDEPSARLATRWLGALDAPRLGRTALVGRGRKGRGGGEPDRGRKERGGGEFDRDRDREGGVFLDTMQRVTVVYLPDATALELRTAIVLPGLSPVLDSGFDERGRPFAAVARFGDRLSFVLERRRDLDADAALGVCTEAARMVAAMAQLGFALPDWRLERFELDAQDRLWLADVDGISAGAKGEGTAHVESILQLCRDILGRARGGIAPPGLFEALRDCTNASAAAGVLARYVKPSA